MLKAVKFPWQMRDGDAYGYDGYRRRDDGYDSGYDSRSSSSGPGSASGSASASAGDRKRRRQDDSYYDVSKIVFSVVLSLYEFTWLFAEPRAACRRRAAAVPQL
jgi:hypothetical protein